MSKDPRHIAFRARTAAHAAYLRGEAAKMKLSLTEFLHRQIFSMKKDVELSSVAGRDERKATNV